MRGRFSYLIAKVVEEHRTAFQHVLMATPLSDVAKPEAHLKTAEELVSEISAARMER